MIEVPWCEKCEERSDEAGCAMQCDACAAQWKAEFLARCAAMKKPENHSAPAPSPTSPHDRARTAWDAWTDEDRANERESYKTIPTPDPRELVRAYYAGAWHMPKGDLVYALEAALRRIDELEKSQAQSGPPPVAWKNGLDEAMDRIVFLASPRGPNEPPGQRSVDARDRMALTYLIDRVNRLTDERNNALGLAKKAEAAFALYRSRFRAFIERVERAGKAATAAMTAAMRPFTPTEMPFIAPDPPATCDVEGCGGKPECRGAADDWLVAYLCPEHFGDSVPFEFEDRP